MHRLTASVAYVTTLTYASANNQWAHPAYLLVNLSKTKPRSVQFSSVMECLHDPANVQQTSSKCSQNTRANARRLLDRVLRRSVRSLTKAVVMTL